MTSIPSLEQALSGSHSVFLVTTPTFTEDSDLELTQGKNVADAAKRAGVQHLIFSSLLNVSESTSGRLKNVPHFDHKAQVEQYIRDLGIPATFVLPGYFMSNYVFLGMLRKGEDGAYTLAYPVNEGSQFPLVDIEADLGELFPYQSGCIKAIKTNVVDQVNTWLLPSRAPPKHRAPGSSQQQTTIRLPASSKNSRK